MHFATYTPLKYCPYMCNNYSNCQHPQHARE